MENNAKAQTLNRSLGLAECVTTTAGAVIGVGLFTVGSQIVGLMGGTVIVASLISFILILFPCAMYVKWVLRCRMQAVLTTTLRELSVCRWQISLHGII